MSASPAARKMPGADATDQRAGAFALVLLRLTLFGVGLAMVATIGSVVWKIIAH